VKRWVAGLLSGVCMGVLGLLLSLLGHWVDVDAVASAGALLYLVSLPVVAACLLMVVILRIARAGRTDA
jgi:hypothetical protein